MAGPVSLRIRAYDVGFGDCFLMTVTYADGDQRHALIDFGSMRSPDWVERRHKDAVKRGEPTKHTLRQHMLEIAGHIATACGGKLQLVVATHRHTDHISGFAGPSGKVIHGLAPDLVILPWTEKRELAPDATGPSIPRSSAGARHLVSGLADMQSVAGFAMREVGRLGADVPDTVKAQLGALGEVNLKNRAAVEALRALAPRTRRRYVHYGSEIDLSSALPGVTVDVLGPPTPRQYPEIRRQAASNRDEFWHLAASTASVRARSKAPLFTGHIQPEVPAEARWIVTRAGKIRAEELLGIVRTLDDALNNTSVILLFEVAGKLLLFPGDAQLENWRYALKDAPNFEANRTRLAKTNVYKVGHHGSLNATPRLLLWDRLENRGPERRDHRLMTLLSTRTNEHGSPRRNTEVPRQTLVDALVAESKLVTTDAVTATSANKVGPWQDLEIDLTVP